MCDSVSACKKAQDANKITVERANTAPQFAVDKKKDESNLLTSRNRTTVSNARPTTNGGATTAVVSATASGAATTSAGTTTTTVSTTTTETHSGADRKPQAEGPATEAAEIAFTGAGAAGGE